MLRHAAHILEKNRTIIFSKIWITTTRGIQYMGVEKVYRMEGSTTQLHVTQKSTFNNKDCSPTFCLINMN